MLKAAQKGFTLIELMIVVAIIGILAAVAIPAYQDYTVRAKVVEGVAAAGAAKASVADFYMTNNAFPTTNAAAGLGTNTGYATGVIKQIDIGTGGSVTVQFNGIGAGVTSGNAIAYVPSATTAGSLTWACNGSGSTLAAKFRPANCR